jgi:hypothetical protein
MEAVTGVQTCALPISASFSINLLSSPLSSEASTFISTIYCSPRFLLRQLTNYLAYFLMATLLISFPLEYKEIQKTKVQE